MPAMWGPSTCRTRLTFNEQQRFRFDGISKKESFASSDEWLGDKVLRLLRQI